MFGLDYYSQQNLHDIKNLLQEQLTFEKRKQVQRDRKFIARYDPENYEQYKKFLEIRSKYNIEKDNALRDLDTKNISSLHDNWPDFYFEEDFLTWDDYVEVNNARKNYVRALIAFKRKQKICAWCWRILFFIGFIALNVYANSLFGR